MLFETKNLYPLNEMIYAFVATLEKICYYTLIILIYCATLGCIASEIFAYRARFSSGYDVATDPLLASSPKQNFDNFSNSLTGLFLFVLNEEWHMVKIKPQTI